MSIIIKIPGVADSRVARAQARFNEGLVLHRNGRLAHAETAYRQAIELKADFAEAHNNRGMVLKVLNRLDEALASYGQAIRIRPDFVEAYNNRGNVLRRLARVEEALADYRRATELDSGYAQAYRNFALTLKELKRLDEALACFDRAIALSPKDAQAYHGRGNVFQELKRYEEALFDYDRAISLKADYSEAYNNRGGVLNALRRWGEAIESYDRAISLNEKALQSLGERAAAHRKLGRMAEAAASEDLAARHKANYSLAFRNRGIALQEMGRMEEALASHDRAVACQPDSATVHLARSLCLLSMGDFSRGWEEYEWRWQAEPLVTNRRVLPQPLWLGKESLQGKTILLHCEQGLGDTLQFCRYARLVRALGARVVLETQKPLLGLLKSLEGVALLIGRGDALPVTDFHCPLMSLPLALETRIETVPSQKSYLAVPRGKVAEWSARLGERGAKRVGLAWSGNADHINDRNRSIALGTLIDHLPGKYQYVSLHRDVREADAQTLRSRADILHFGEQLADFTDTAAVCELMDVVVTVDTSVAHLAGAIGKAAWILLPFTPDWRWMQGRADSPWYPGARLFRQQSAGDWDGVLARVKNELTRLLG